MAIALRQSTASQEIPLGHFVDSTDGVTAETGLTIANTDIKIWKSGATTLANKNSGGATHISGGIYYAVLDATDTDTVGGMIIFCAVSGALAVRLECHVYEEAIYDALYAASAPGYLQSTVAGRTLDVTATGAAGIDWGNVENKTTANVLSGTEIADVNVATIRSNAITASAIATGAITSAKFAAGAIDAAAIAANAIGASELAADAVAEIADAVWDEALSGHLTVGSTGNALNAAGSAGDPWSTSLPGAYGAGTAGKIIGDNINAPIATVDTVVDAIKAKTDYLPSATAGTAGGVFIAGSNAATAANITGNITGNLSGSVGSVAGNVGGDVVGDVQGTVSELVVPIALIDSNVDSLITSVGALNDLSVADVEGTLTAIHLDHLFATDYNPASKPGTATALLNELIESDGGVSRFTANALEQAPSGGGGGTTDWTADERTALRAILGIPASGTTPDAPSAGALKVIDDFLDTEIADIQARLPAALTAGGNIKADMLAISGDTTAADNLESATDGTGYNVGNGSVVAASVTGAVGSVTGNVGGNVTGSVGSVASGGISAASIATGAIDADALAADAVDEILDEIVEGSTTLRQAVRLLLALTNKTTRSGSTIYFRDIADTKNRLAITIDSNADRTAVTRDAT